MPPNALPPRTEGSREGPGRPAAIVAAAPVCGTQIFSVKSAEQLARMGSCGWNDVAYTRSNNSNFTSSLCVEQLVCEGGASRVRGRERRAGVHYVVEDGAHQRPRLPRLRALRHPREVERLDAAIDERHRRPLRCWHSVQVGHS